MEPKPIIHRGIHVIEHNVTYWDKQTPCVLKKDITSLLICLKKKVGMESDNEEPSDKFKLGVVFYKTTGLYISNASQSERQRPRNFQMEED